MLPTFPALPLPLAALLQATCSTMAWLDAWTRLLLKQKLSLEQQLSYFTTVRPTEGLVRHPERSDWSTPGVPSVPTGGKVRGTAAGRNVLARQACLMH